VLDVMCERRRKAALYFFEGARRGDFRFAGSEAADAVMAALSGGATVAREKA